jgi:hypothetical protein
LSKNFAADRHIKSRRAETLDWTSVLIALDRQALEPGIVEETLGSIAKYQMT